MLTKWKSYQAHDWITPWLDDAYELYVAKFGKDDSAEDRWKTVEVLLNAGDYAQMPVAPGALQVLVAASPLPKAAQHDLEYANAVKAKEAADFQAEVDGQAAAPPGTKSYTSWTLTALHVRSSPGTAADTLRTLKKGTKIRIWEGNDGKQASPVTIGGDQWVGLVGGGWVAYKYQGQYLVGSDPPKGMQQKELADDESVAPTSGSGGTAVLLGGVLLAAWLLPKALKRNPHKRR